MTEEQRENSPPEAHPYSQPYIRMTVLERYQISPVLFAFMSLIVVFILYQIVGGLITFILFGLNPIAAKASEFRIATGVGQIIFIFVPTLLLVRFVTFHPAEFFRIKFPDISLFVLALVGIFSLQQVLQILMVFQEKIPIPEKLEQFLQPFKDMIEVMYKMLVGANSVPELLLVIFVVAFIPSICEEFLFRGLVQRSFERSLGPVKGMLLAGVIFGAYHLNPFAFIPLSMLGVYLGFLAMQGGSIWLAVTAHFFNNALACVAMYLHVDEDAVITGNPDTMATSELLVTIVFFSAIFVFSTYLFLYLTKKPPPEPPSVPTDSIAL